MKRKVLALLMAMSVTMGIAACGSNEDAVTPLLDIEDEEVVEDSEVPEDNVTLGSYYGLEVEVTDTTVTEEEIETEIDSILAQYAEYEDVTDRPVEDGDIANIDYSGSVDGEVFEGGTAEEYDLEIGSGSFIDGFEEQLIGAEIGDNFDIDVTFPESYSSEELAGQDAVFNVTINGIQEKIVPELDDDFLTEYTENETVEDFKAEVEEYLIDNKISEAESERAQTLLNAAVEGAEVKYYPVTKMNAQIRYMDKIYSAYYGMDIDTVREQLVESEMATEEEFDQDLWDSSKDSVKMELVILAIAAEESMEVSDEEYEEMLSNIMTSLSYEDEDEFLEHFGEEFVKAQVLYDQVIELLEEQSVEV